MIPARSVFHNVPSLCLPPGNRFIIPQKLWVTSLLSSFGFTPRLFLFHLLLGPDQSGAGSKIIKTLARKNTPATCGQDIRRSAY
jgi:hypothetical protein